MTEKQLDRTLQNQRLIFEKISKQIDDNKELQRDIEECIRAFPDDVDKYVITSFQEKIRVEVLMEYHDMLEKILRNYKNYKEKELRISEWIDDNKKLQRDIEECIRTFPRDVYEYCITSFQEKIDVGILLMYYDMLEKILKDYKERRIKE